MKKSLIAIAALGIISGSAFAETESKDVNFDISVLSSCTFDNFQGTTKVATAPAGVTSIDLGTHEYKRTCSLAMGYKMYVDSPTVLLDNSTSPDANGEVLKVTAYVDQIGGELPPIRSGGQGPDHYWGTGFEQTEVLAFQVTNAAGGRIINKHNNDSGKITLTVEYVPH